MKDYIYNKNYRKEGIDTVTLTVDPLYITNPEKWFCYSDGKAYSRKSYIDWNGNQFFYINLQEEYIPKECNYLNFLLGVVIQRLIVVEKLINPIGYAGNLFDSVSLYNWLKENYKSFLKLYTLDFHFDFENIYWINQNGPYLMTAYSSKNHSALKLYYRPSKEAAFYRAKPGSKNFAKYFSMKYPWRLEFHFDIFNSKYLFLENLDGNFEDIFYRYVFLLAKVFTNFYNMVGRVYNPGLLQYPYFSLVEAVSQLPPFYEKGSKIKPTRIYVTQEDIGLF